MRTMRWTIVLFLLLWLCALGQDSVPLLTTSNDRDSAKDIIRLQVDKENHALKILHWRDDHYWEYPVDQLAEGVILRKSKGREVVTLKSVKFDPTEGGLLRLRYLYSGIPPRKYRHLDLHLRPDTQGWSFFCNDLAVKNLHLKVHRKKILGEVGIKTIEPQPPR